MAEALFPLDELEALKFSVAALAENHADGSYKQEMARNACRGIQSRLDWCIRQLKAAGEGERNMGV